MSAATLPCCNSMARPQRNQRSLLAVADFRSSSTLISPQPDRQIGRQIGGQADRHAERQQVRRQVARQEDEQMDR